jgi:hypothetical protein
MDSNLPVPNNHCEVLYRQTFNTYGDIDTTYGLTQDNRVGNGQKTGNTRLTTSTNKGILAGSVVAIVGESTIGPAISTYGSDSTVTSDKVVGIAVNDAVGNPYGSSSAVASNKVVYAHGTGTVIKTDIYETQQYTNTSNSITYAYGDKIYASRNGLLTNSTGLNTANQASAAAGTAANMTIVGILLQKPTTTDPWMVVQLRV